jgi:hypothetical protein
MSWNCERGMICTFCGFGWPKAFSGKICQRTLVAGLEAEQCGFETRQQVAIADLEGRRGFVERAVDRVAILQAQCEMQGDFRVLADALLSQYLISH